MTQILTINGIAIGPVHRTHRGELEVRLPDYTTLAAMTEEDLVRRVQYELAMLTTEEDYTVVS